MPAGTDVVVTFDYTWIWDMTMYLFNLDIDFKDPATHKIIATGTSHHPSLQRTTPDNMAHEALDSIFKSKPKAA